jgi:hypothetical protein
MNSQLFKALQWAFATTLAVLLLYATFRSYRGADFLIGFANLFVC